MEAKQNMAAGSEGMMVQGVGTQNGKGMIIGMVCMAILAVGGIGFGVYGMLQSSQKDNQISDLKVQIKGSDGTITTIETPEIEATKEDGTTVVINDSVIKNENTKDYIYVGEWGLKIKIPEELTVTGYEYNALDGYTSIGIAGATENGQYLPEFADASKHGYMISLGYISRYPKGVEMPLASTPSFVFSDEQYDYYYSHPQSVISTNENEVHWELDSVDVIEQMLMDENNYSKI